MFASSVMGHITVSGFLKLWVGIMSAITKTMSYGTDILTEV